ncbi:MAG: hypothetical protein MK193_00750 [Lentisphaeria bacterium]|nr:hypothetical protein [Lentisphaeria bacterium]
MLRHLLIQITCLFLMFQISGVSLFVQLQFGVDPVCMCVQTKGFCDCDHGDDVACGAPLSAPSSSSCSSTSIDSSEGCCSKPEPESTPSSCCSLPAPEIKPKGCCSSVEPQERPERGDLSFDRIPCGGDSFPEFLKRMEHRLLYMKDSLFSSNNDLYCVAEKIYHKYKNNYTHLFHNGIDKIPIFLS